MCADTIAKIVQLNGQNSLSLIFSFVLHNREVCKSINPKEQGHSPKESLPHSSYWPGIQDFGKLRLLLTLSKFLVHILSAETQRITQISFISQHKGNMTRLQFTYIKYISLWQMTLSGEALDSVFWCLRFYLSHESQWTSYVIVKPWNLKSRRTEKEVRKNFSEFKKRGGGVGIL